MKLTDQVDVFKRFEIAFFNVQAEDGKVHLSIRNADISEEIIWFFRDLSPVDAERLAALLVEVAAEADQNPVGWGLVSSLGDR